MSEIQQLKTQNAAMQKLITDYMDERDLWREDADRLAVAGRKAIVECCLEHRDLRDALAAHDAITRE